MHLVFKALVPPVLVGGGTGKKMFRPGRLLNYAHFSYGHAGGDRW